MLSDIAVDSNGDMVCLLDKSYYVYPNELWILRRLGPDNWVDERIDNGNLEPADGTFNFSYCFYDNSDRLLILAYVGDFTGEAKTADYRLYSWNSSHVAVESTCDVTNMKGCLYKLDDVGSCAYFSSSAGNPREFIRFEHGTAYVEDIQTFSCTAISTGVSNFYHAYAEMEYNTDPGVGYDYVHEFRMRVDPRE